MNPGRAPFDVTITLPGGRAYHARAEMAVMLSSTRAGDPDRLTVQLPPASPDATARLIGEYAAQWGFPANAVTAWRASASRGAPGDRYYGTHVFTPPRSASCTWSSRFLTMCPNATSSSRPCFPGTPRPAVPAETPHAKTPDHITAQTIPRSTPTDDPPTTQARHATRPTQGAGTQNRLMAGSLAGTLSATCRTEPGDPYPATDLAARRPTSGSAEMSISSVSISIHCLAYSLTVRVSPRPDAAFQCPGRKSGRLLCGAADSCAASASDRAVQFWSKRRHAAAAGRPRVMGPAAGRSCHQWRVPAERTRIPRISVSVAVDAA